MRLAGVLLGPAILAFLIVTGLSYIVREPSSESQTQATGVAWDGRVFTSRQEFARWLAERGGSYQEWNRLHPRSPWATTRTAKAASASAAPKPAPEAERGSNSVVVAILAAALVLVIGLLAIAAALLVRMKVTINRLTEPPLRALPTVPSTLPNGARSVEATRPRLAVAGLAARRRVEAARPHLVSAGLVVRRGVDATRPRLVRAGLAVRRRVEATRPAGSDRRSVLRVASVTGALGALAVGVLSGVSLQAMSGLVVLVTLVTIVALTRVTAISWSKLIGALGLIVLLIPIRRYSLPGDLPFQLELYRVFVAFIVLGWFASLLVDPRTHFRRTGFEGPILFIVGAAFASIVANPERVAPVSAEVEKSLMFFLSFVLVLYLTVSVVRRLDSVDYLAKTLVAGGAIVALSAIIEARTGFNVFNHLSRPMPFLHDSGDVGGYQRVGTAKLRVFASAQHPIALSAALVLLAPVAVYLARRYRQRRWMLCALALVAASAATVSRTGILMFVVVGAVFLWLRPQETRRLWPLLVLAPVVIHFVLPGTLGAIKQSFLPAGGLLAEQRASAQSSGSGRLADLGPGLRVWRDQPLVGQGFGTQVVDLDKAGVESNILDNQWLGTLIGTGAVGFFGWLWFFVRAVRRFGTEAKRDDSERGWLLAAIAACVAAYAVGMLTFDAFAFIQVTFLLCILVGLGAALLAERPTPLAIRAGVRS